MLAVPEGLGGLTLKPTPAVLGGGVLVLLILWSAISSVRQYYRLRHVKGPIIAAFSKLWYFNRVGSGRAHLDLYEVCEKYGSIARVGPNELVTNEPELLKRMLNVRTKYQRSAFYDGMRFDPSKDNVLSLRDDQAHNKLRAKMAHGYSGKEVENLEVKIDKNIQSLIRLIETKYVAVNQPLDMGRKIQFFTMDTLSDIAFGEAFGFLTTDSDMFDYCKIFEKQMPTIMLSTVFPVIIKILQWPLIKRTLPSDKDPLGFGKILGLAKGVAHARYAPDAKRQNDMLGSFMAHGLTLEEAESEIMLQLLAGTDTTATAIRTTLLYVMTNPRVLNALLAEISSTKSLSPDSIISDEAARAMPYLQAVIKEGLRIHPPVVGIMTKVVPPGGDEFEGVVLPEGTLVGYCAWGVMRRHDVWGADSAEFRPDRWLEASPEKLREMESTLDLVFGHGRWQCLGKNIALMELNKVFVELFRRFDLVLVDPTNPWESINAGVFIQRNFWVRAYKRG